MAKKGKKHTDLLWSGDVARICSVTEAAVAKWIKKGQLKAFRTPGGRFRIKRQDFIEFLRKHDFPIPPELAAEAVPRILIVEDDSKVAWMLQWALRSAAEKYSVTVAESGFRAAYLVYSFRPDLIVLDLRLPGLDGVEVCKIVKEGPASSHTKIVVVSAYLNNANAQELKQAGAEALLSKPVDVEELRKTVRRLLFGKGIRKGK